MFGRSVGRRGAFNSIEWIPPQSSYKHPRTATPFNSIEWILVEEVWPYGVYAVRVILSIPLNGFSSIHIP